MPLPKWVFDLLESGSTTTQPANSSWPLQRLELAGKSLVSATPSRRPHSVDLVVMAHLAAGMAAVERSLLTEAPQRSFPGIGAEERLVLALTPTHDGPFTFADSQVLFPLLVDC